MSCASASVLASLGVVGPGNVGALDRASTDLLLDDPLETRCRFLEFPSSSSKGFGLVEQGSEETARSRNNSGESRSIGRRQSCVSL